MCVEHAGVHAAKITCKAQMCLLKIPNEHFPKNITLSCIDGDLEGWYLV